MEEKKIIVGGVKWIGGLEILTRLIQMVVLLVIARIISPEEYGIFALLMVFFRFVQAFGDFGLIAALIQKRDIESRHYQTAFWLIEGLTVFFMVLTLVFQEQFGQLFRIQAITLYYDWMIVPFLLYPYGLIPRAMLNRTFQFKVLAMVDFLSVFANLVVTLVLAVYGFSVWSFIAGLYVEIIVANGLLWWKSRWVPDRTFSIPAMKELLSYGTNVLFTRLMNFANINIVPLLIARLYGSAALGIYSMTYQIMEMPVQRIAKNIMKVLFPVLCQVQDKIGKYAEILTGTVRLVLYLLIFVYFAIYVGVQEVVTHFLYEKWSGVLPILGIMTIIGLLRSYWMFFSTVFLSKGKPAHEWQLHLVLTISFLLPLLVFRTHFTTIRSFIALWMVAWMITFLVGHRYLAGHLGACFIYYLKGMVRPVIYGGLVGMLVGLRIWLHMPVEKVFHAVVEVAGFLLVVVSIFLVLDGKKLFILKNMFRPLSGKSATDWSERMSQN